MSKKRTVVLMMVFTLNCVVDGSVPIIINTWEFPDAAEKVWSATKQTSLTAVDMVVLGATTCEESKCNHSVGYGGNPDENGETTLDAMIFDGATMNIGGVGGLRRIKNAIKVARHVLENTKHSLLVGDLATNFAKNFDFKEESLSTNYSNDMWNDWQSNNCQPNFWQNVDPDATKSCGPYENVAMSNKISNSNLGKENHDTIGVIAIDENGNVAAGTSTNGLNHKIPGRVGDSPLPGAGSYADNEVGAAVATGDGDVMMRFLPTFLAVEALRQGRSPSEAAKLSIERIAQKYPDFYGAVIVTTNKGEFGAACNGMESFPFCVANKESDGVTVYSVDCS